MNILHTSIKTWLIMLGINILGIQLVQTFYPVIWSQLQNSNNSFYANLCWVGLLLITTPLLIGLFMAFLIYESYWKSKRSYDPFKRKWVKK